MIKFAAEAAELSRKHGYSTMGNDNPADAFKRMYVSAAFTAKHGKTIAKVLGNLNEIVLSADPRSRKMDECNNALGKNL